MKDSVFILENWLFIFVLDFSAKVTCAFLVAETMEKLSEINSM